MNIRKIVNDYVECNTFEVRYINGKVTIFYYDEIGIFTSNKIEVKYDDKKIIVKGKDLIIETMFKEYLIISGNIKSIEF